MLRMVLGLSGAGWWARLSIRLLCSVGFVNSKVVTDAIFLLAFAKSPSARWGSERLEAHLIGGQPWTWSCSESVCSV